MWLHAGGIGESNITPVIGQCLYISQRVAVQGGFSSHREIKRVGGVPKGLFPNPTPILGNVLASQVFKDRFA